MAIDYLEKVEEMPGGWVVPVNLYEDNRRITNPDSTTAWPRPFGVALTGLHLRVEVVSEAWNPPGGTYDMTSLAEPGVFDNVEKGFGFVGGGYRNATSWTLVPEVVEAAGFIYPSGCTPFGG